MRQPQRCCFSGWSQGSAVSVWRGRTVDRDVADQRLPGRTWLLPGFEETAGDFRKRGERPVERERGHGVGIGFGQAHGHVIRVLTAGPLPGPPDVREAGGVRFDGFSRVVGGDERIPVRVLAGGCAVLTRVEHEVAE